MMEGYFWTSGDIERVDQNIDKICRSENYVFNFSLGELDEIQLFIEHYDEILNHDIDKNECFFQDGNFRIKTSRKDPHPLEPTKEDILRWNRKEKIFPKVLSIVKREFERRSTEINDTTVHQIDLDLKQHNQDKTNLGVLIELGILDAIREKLREPKNSNHIVEALLKIGLIDVNQVESYNRQIRKVLSKNESFWNPTLKQRVSDELNKLKLK